MVSVLKQLKDENEKIDLIHFVDNCCDDEKFRMEFLEFHSQLGLIINHYEVEIMNDIIDYEVLGEIIICIMNPNIMYKFLFFNNFI